MRSKRLFSRLLSVVLVLAMVVSSMGLSAFAAEDTGASVSFSKVDNSSVSASPTDRATVEDAAEETTYADTDEVRVSIVLDEKSTIAAGYSTESIAENNSAEWLTVPTCRRSRIRSFPVSKLLPSRIWTWSGT